MKKIYLSISVFLLGLVLVACGPKDTRPVISYAAWNLGTVEENNIERRLIAAYQEAHPEIRIEVIPRPAIVNEDGVEQDVSWFDFFTTRASTGNLPDVFQVADVTSWIKNGWVEDIADLAANDPDLALVPDDLAYNAQYGDYLFALPQAMFYYGFFINRTAAGNIVGNKPVEYGISFNDLMAAAKANYQMDLIGSGSGTAGIDGVSSFIEWLPSQYDANLDWFTYTSEGYNLNGTAFATAMAEQRQYFQEGADVKFPYVLDTIDETNRLVQYNTTDPWSAGKMSIKWAASYNLRDWVGNTQNPNHALYGHDIDFIGTPSVGENHRVPVIMDYIAVGRGTKMREEAYDFARYMAYGVEGFKKRIEIAKNNPEAGAINFAPLAQDKELLDEYFALYPSLTEFRKLVETHESFIFESLWKTTPGYWESRSNAAYDDTNNIGTIINKVVEGELQLADVANNLNFAANDAYEKAKKALDDALANFKPNETK